MSTINTTINHGISIDGVAYTSPLSITSTGAINNTTASGFAIRASGNYSIANQGTVSASGSADVGVYLAGGGTVTNYGANAVIFGNYTGIRAVGAPAVVVNQGRISGTFYGVSLTAGGMITNTTGATVTSLEATGVYVGGGAGTVLNQGIIGGGAVSTGVILAAGGTVTNQGSIGANYAGLYFKAGGTMINQGIVNSGSIGVNLRAGGVASNAAGDVIYGGEYGVIAGGVSTITNFGRITGGGFIGVDLTAGGTIIDGGTITGSGAVALGGTGNNLLILERGYSITGAITGSASASNTLELLGTSAAYAVTANYNSLALTNFGTVAFAPSAGNYATLDITNDATLPHTITNFTGTHDTIDLTTLGFVSGSSSATFDTASDKLTVSNGTNAVTLQLGAGSYSGISFTAVSDGATGTDIIAGPAVLTYDWIGPSADWRTATDWSSDVIPGISASATIADAGNNTVTISSSESIQVANLTLSNADTLLVAGTFAPTGSIGVTGALLSVASGGTVTNFATLNVAGTGTLANSGTLIDGGGLLDGGTLTNAGSIIGTGTGRSSPAVSLVGSGTLVNLAGGNITSGAGSGVYWNAGISTVASTVTNFGTISGNGGDGVFFFTSGGVVTNHASVGANATISGSIVGVYVNGNPTPAVVTNTGGTNATALITGGADGVYLFASGTVTNTDGTITGGKTGVDMADGTGTLINTGDVNGAALITGGSVGVFTGPTNGGLIANTGGTIIGSSVYGIEIFGDATVTNTGGTNAGALIQGGKSGIYLGGLVLGDTVINTNGTIIGISRYGIDGFQGGSVTNAGTGVISGAVAGVLMSHQAQTESVANYATIIGGIGVEVFGAGTVTDAGTIIGTGGTAITLAGEGDTLKFVPGNAFIQGQVTGFEYNNKLEFASGATVGTLTGSGANFQNFPHGTVDAGANWVLAGGITLASSVTLANSGTLTDSGTLINGGTITGLALEVPQLELAPGGYLLNQATGIIKQNAGDGVYGQASGASTVTNFGTIAGYGGIGIGVYLKGGGSVTNASAAALLKGDIDGISFVDAAGTVVNDGSIVGLGSLGNGVFLLSGGTVTNEAGGVISGGDGIRMGGVGTVLNQGSIAGGTIDGGVVLMGSGTVGNAATGVISGAAYGIGALGRAMVTNAGTIRATGLVGVGVTLVSGGTVIDSGTIAGSTTAVAFGGTASNLLILEHGYALTGGVVGSASASNTVELLGTSAANAVTANYNGLGLTNVGTVAFAPGARNFATLTITNDTTLPGTITNFIGAHDTIDLTTLSDAGNDAFTSFNTLTDVLTVTGDNGSVQLQLGNADYSGVTWVATPDSGTGTDVHPEAVSLAPIAIDGTVADQPTTDEATIDPFSSVTITDPNGAQTDTVTVTLSDKADGSLSGPGGGSYDPATGVYTVSGTAAQVTTALDDLVFTPTAHQVAPGDAITTTFTIGVTDTANVSASDNTTSVVATAVNDPPTITHVTNNVGVRNETSATPFDVLTVSDPDVGHTDTVTVTLSDPSGGTLSNLDGGSFDATTGVYTVSGTPDAVTTALDGLTFTPVASTNSDVRTTSFTVEVTGPGGSDSVGSISVSAVRQVLQLATIPGSDVVISVSPDGTGFAAATKGKTNEAVVSDPSAGGTYTLPGGYQAGFLGGTAGATLTDVSVGGALLDGNAGSSHIIAIAGNDTILGGIGTDTLDARGSNDTEIARGSDDVAIAAGDSDVAFAVGLSDSLIVSGSNDTLVGGTGHATLQFTSSATGGVAFAGSGTMAITDDGSHDTMVGGSGSTTATIFSGEAQFYSQTGTDTVLASGQGDTLVGGSSGHSTFQFTSSANGGVAFGGSATTAITDAGSNDTLTGGSGSTTATLSGSGAVFFSEASTASVLDSGQGDTIVAGSAATSVTSGGSGLLVFAGSGSLNFIGGSAGATIASGSGNATIAGGSGGITLFGAAGGAIDYTGTSGGLFYAAGSGNETLDASGATTDNVMLGGHDTTGHDSVVGGSGNDTFAAGSGSDTLVGGASSHDLFDFFSVNGGAAANDVIVNFTGNDTVFLSGYGAGAATTALDNATSANGSTTITLSDNTQITFAAIGSASELQGHVIST